MPTTTAGDEFVSILREELMDLEGIHLQNPETGANIRGNDGVTTYIDSYTNRIFGSPFQLLDSVDKRFDKVNPFVGNEYLRHFILNSPILHIKPGMPKYTGGADGSAIAEAIKETYLGASTNGWKGAMDAVLLELAKGTIFSAGSKLQKRMFGFRETYYQYSQHVNYMCRSMATFLGLGDTSYFAFSGKNFYTSWKTASGKLYPDGAFAWYKGADNNSGNGYMPFRNFKWENYRMLDTSKVLTPLEMLQSLGKATLVGDGIDKLLNTLGLTFNTLGQGLASMTSDAASAAISGIVNGSVNSGVEDYLNSLQNRNDNISETWSNGTADYSEDLTHAWNTSMTDVLTDKISTVEFMVEPCQFDENITNETAPSAIASQIEAGGNDIGSELAFITNSKVDAGIVGSLVNFLGDTAETASKFVSGIIEPIAGGFASNLLNGAVSSLRGQKMIYPEIYKSTTSTMEYPFVVNLSSPYGDVYNYYMNIVVPLCHLLCLAAPRMVTSNTVQSPYLVQAYIPGMMTCQLGIISNMTISKNPNNRVSVNGFPLEIKVSFTIKELYHSMAISPANDPASFLFNETLNDYMANLAGLIPSVNTYTRQRRNALKSVGDYFTSGDWANDIANTVLEGVENLINPFVANGS